MNPLHEKRKVLGHCRAMSGGDSSSSSTQNTNYSLTDSRSVSSVDSHDTTIHYNDNRQDNRVAVWADSSKTTTNTTTNVTATDFGSVAAGQAVSIEALKQNSTNTQALFSLADKLFTGTAKAMDANTELTKTLSATAAEAYDGATSQANGNKTMLLAALAVVGVVAAMAFMKK